MLPSIVPSLDSMPASPRNMLIELILAGAVMFAFLSLFSMFATPFVLALPQVDMWSMMRVTVSQLVIGGVMLVWSARKSVQRARPVYNTLLLGTRDVPLGPPPPLNAVQAAFGLPEQISYRSVGCMMLVPLLDVLDVLDFSGLRGFARIAVDLLSMTVNVAGTMPTIVVFRTIIWDWLGRLHPTDVPLPATERLARRMASTVTLPVAVVGMSGAVALASHLFALRTRLIPQIDPVGMSTELDVTAAVLSLLMILLTSSLAYAIAAKLGGQLARDLRTLTERIDVVRRAQSPSDSAALESLREIAHTPAGEKLAEALSELARRFAEMSEKERRGRIAMEQVQRLRTRFLASMSHDLRSPLNSIVGFATLIESGAEGPVSPEQRESISMITRSARDLLRLVTNILDSARLEAGRLRLARSWKPAAEVLSVAVQEGRRLIGDRPLSIEAELTAGLPEVYVDQDRIVQAVVGLFSHAIDAMREGSIRLWAGIAAGPIGSTGPHLCIDVSDRGQGIREADQAALFEAFREMQEPSGKRIGGLGLGLSVARELIRAHGGDITFESAPGVGTTFRVAIPLESQDAKARTARPFPRTQPTSASFAPPPPQPSIPPPLQSLPPAPPLPPAMASEPRVSPTIPPSSAQAFPTPARGSIPPPLPAERTSALPPTPSSILPPQPEAPSRPARVLRPPKESQGGGTRALPARASLHPPPAPRRTIPPPPPPSSLAPAVLRPPPAPPPRASVAPTVATESIRPVTRGSLPPLGRGSLPPLGRASLPASSTDSIPPVAQPSIPPPSPNSGPGEKKL